MKLLEKYNSQEYKGKQDGQIKTIIQAGNGTFEKYNSWLGYSIKKIDNIESEYPFFEEKIEITNIKNYPKIPKKALLSIMSWYNQINEKYNCEAQVNFYFDKNIKTIKIDNSEMLIKDIKGVKYWSDNIFSYTPVQTNTSSSTSTQDKIYYELNKQIGMYIETHSHNNMPAFMSSTDYNNSLNNAIQLVFGCFNTDTIEMHSWCTIRGLTKEYIPKNELELYIELPECDYNEKYYFNKQNLNDFNDTIWNSQIEYIQ